MKGNLLFLTGCYPKEFSDYYINNSKVMPQNAANVLSWRLIEGFTANLQDKFTILTCPFIGYFPKGFKKAIIRDSQWSHDGVSKDFQLGFLNIKGIETYIKSERIFYYVKKWYKQSVFNRNILIYSHYAGFMRAAGMIKKAMPDMHITCLVTDMNECDPRPDLLGIKGKIKGIPRQIMINTTYKNLKYIDSFVLLAEKMKDYLGVGERPYVIVEGIADKNVRTKSTVIDGFEKSDKEFRVVYTGTMHKRYGSVVLANAFKLLEEKNIKLYICGSGDGEEEVKEIAEENNNVNFLGSIPHNKAIALQASADLLVNSMPEFGIHTALSFPSKTMEYMIMGKPVACFKVSGIPDEYDDYLMYFDEYSAEAIAKKILEISKMSEEELQKKAVANRQFALDNKNAVVQTNKILQMLNKG